VSYIITGLCLLNRTEVDWNFLLRMYWLQILKRSQVCSYEGVPKSFRTESITKYTLTNMNTRWDVTQRVMAAKLIRRTHKIAIYLHLVAESCTIFSSRSRSPVRKRLDTLSYYGVINELKSKKMLKSSGSRILVTEKNDYHICELNVRTGTVLKIVRVFYISKYPVSNVSIPVLWCISCQIKCIHMLLPSRTVF
jgi:hypothetical protein